MAQVNNAINGVPMEMKGSGRWNLYYINENGTIAGFGPTIDMRLAPGGNLIGTGMDENNKMADIYTGKWNERTIEFTVHKRYGKRFAFKGSWSQDFGIIRGESCGNIKQKFEMVLESQKPINNTSKQSEYVSNNLANYFKNSPDKMFYDFHIVSKDGEKIEAHKFMLCSQSEYFAALFRIESPACVKLDYPGNAIKSSIDFLYSHKVDINIDNAQDILAFSNYTNLKSLEDLATTFIIQNMDMSNVSEILMLSDFLANEPLKNASLSFFAKNFQKLFQTNNDFLNIPKHLFKQIIGSKSLILYTTRGIIITGEEREYGVLSFIKTFVEVHNIQDQILDFLPYLRLKLDSDEIRQKIFSSLSMEMTPFEVSSTEARDYAYQEFKLTNLDKWGRAPEGTFSGKRSFEAFGNQNKFIDSIVVTEKEWDGTTLVSGLKINWSDGSSDIVGSQEGNQVKLEVPEGDHVVFVIGKAGWYVDSLALVTSSGKVVGPAGGDGGDCKNAMSCLDSDCEITKTFLDGMKGSVVRTNSNPDTWTVARLQFKFVLATNKKPQEVIPLERLPPVATLPPFVRSCHHW